MKSIPTAQLYSYHYSIHFINSLRQFWKKKQFFSCIGNPKKNSMLLYLDGCRGEYCLKNGQTLIIPTDHLVYIPEGMEYYVRLFDFSTEESGTVGINFSLLDQDYTPFLLDGGIQSFLIPEAKRKICRLDEAGKRIPSEPAIMKAELYELLTLISKKEKARQDQKYNIIEKGIRILEQESNSSQSIGEIAALCNVSEVYFRKKFKEYSGKSPAEYRLCAKLERAKQYLVYHTLNTSEVAEITGFETPSYFCKQFKQYTGLSPLEYRKKHS